MFIIDCNLSHAQMKLFVLVLHLVNNVCALQNRSTLLERICKYVDGPADRTNNTIDTRTNDAPLILQFGVKDGRTLRKIYNVAADEFKKSTTSRAVIWGFDSFIGLPHETVGNYAALEWKPGAYSAAKRTNNRSLQQFHIETSMARIRGGKLDDVRLVPGFYKDSLSRKLATQIASYGPAAYIDVDCDLYSSTYQALDWVFSNGLVAVGTMIGYDDWWVLPCILNRSYNIDQLGGEARAHVDIALKYNVTFDCVCGPCVATANFTYGWRTYYTIRHFSSAQAGFSMPANHVKTFMSENKGCVYHRRHKHAYLL